MGTFKGIISVTIGATLTWVLGALLVSAITDEDVTVQHTKTAKGGN